MTGKDSGHKRAKTNSLATAILTSLASMSMWLTGMAFSVEKGGQKRNKCPIGPTPKNVWL